jgi:hypothetical protein
LVIDNYFKNYCPNREYCYTQADCNVNPNPPLCAKTDPLNTHQDQGGPSPYYYYEYIFCPADRLHTLDTGSGIISVGGAYCSRCNWDNFYVLRDLTPEWGTADVGFSCPHVPYLLPEEIADGMTVVPTNYDGGGGGNAIVWGFEY